MEIIILLLLAGLAYAILSKKIKLVPDSYLKFRAKLHPAIRWPLEIIVGLFILNILVTLLEVVVGTA